MANKFCSICCHINVRIGWTIFGILFGISAILTYAIKFHNWGAFTICTIATIFACQTLWLYWGIKKETIYQRDPSIFKWMIWPNIILGILGLITMTVCFIIAGITKQGAGTVQAMYGENLWFAGSWGFVVTKWTWQNAFISTMILRQIAENSKIGDFNESVDEKI